MVNAADLIRQIVSIRERFDKSRENYMNAHKSFIKNKDARITIFSRCIVLMDSALLYLMFRTFQLPSDSWWSSLPAEYMNLGISPNMILNPSLEDRLAIIDAVDSFWSASYVILLFSSLESSVRTIVRVVYPNKFNDGRGNLMQIYQRLLSTNFRRYKCLLDLLRLSRNTMHNNGVYFPETKEDNRDVTYKNITYRFMDGQIVQFGDLPKLLFFEISPELLMVINEIVNSTDVSKHTQIIDPSR